MSRALHILTACSDTKIGRVDPELRLRSIGAGSIASRAQRWLARLRAVDQAWSLRPASEVYGGVYWSDVRRLVAQASTLGFDVTHWVMSAGYGLLRADHRIAPYSATFAPRNADSVSSGAEIKSPVLANQEWWNQLTTVQGRVSIAALAEASPQASMLIIGSPDYVKAIAADLEAALAAHRRRDRVVVLTSRGTARVPALAESIVENDARMVHRVKGALVSLHPRTASFLLKAFEGVPLSAARASRLLLEAIEQCPAFEWPKRSPMSDAEVRDFVAAELRRTPAARASSILRLLRNSGRACEQSRFRRLYKSVQENL